MVSDPTALKRPEQVIPVPTTLSPQAQTYLTQRTAQLTASGQTHVEPQALSAFMDPMLDMMRPLAAGFQGSATVTALPSGAELHRANPDGTTGRLAEVAYFDIHGGGFVVGGGEMCALTAKLKAADYGAVVFSVDYRMLPDHPYPAALDDCLEAYTEVLKSYPPSALVVAGTSAGGNLAAALMLHARDEGLPLPAGLFLFTPALDLTLAGDSHQTYRFLDVNLYGGVDYIRSYAGAEDLEHPYVSPVLGNFDRGWPQTLLATGTRDLRLSDTVRMHRALRRAGVTAELHVVEAGPHGGFLAASPEDTEIMAEARRFTYSAWGAPTDVGALVG